MEDEKKVEKDKNQEKNKRIIKNKKNNNHILWRLL